MTALLLLLLASGAFAEISVIKGPDGRAVHLLKITEPVEDLVWRTVTLGEHAASVLNPAGDEKGDLEPIIVIETRHPAESTGNRTIPGGVDPRSAPTSQSTRRKITAASMANLGIPDVSDFPSRFTIIGTASQLASFALAFDQDFRLMVIWPSSESEGYRLVWSSWDSERGEWKAPSRVTSFLPAGDEVRPVLSADQQGRLLLTWLEDGMRPAAWCSLWLGDGWSAAIEIQPEGTSERR